MSDSLKMMLPYVMTMIDECGKNWYPSGAFLIGPYTYVGITPLKESETDDEFVVDSATAEA